MEQTCVGTPEDDLVGACAESPARAFDEPGGFRSRSQASVGRQSDVGRKKQVILSELACGILFDRA
jgi:hypothetical protein